MQVTKLKWSKQSGHNILIAGYSNGMVAIWNLKNTSPLLHEIKDECIHLFPYMCFQAHASAVLGIENFMFKRLFFILFIYYYYFLYKTGKDIGKFSG